MSGLEVAGLILGAFPIAVEALKICREGVQTFRRARKYENELERLVNRFENERVRLQDVCEKLLIDLVPHSRIERLIENPLDLFHDEPDLEVKLRKRLWKGYATFEATLKDIKAAIDEATAQINGQMQDKSGIKKALRHSSLNDLLSRINEGLSVIERLAQRSIELEPARKGRFQGQFLTIVRTMADELFRAVRTGFDCSCEHHVCLQLERRTCDSTPTDRWDYLFVKNVDFHLALSYEDLRTSFQERGWSEALVQVTPISHLRFRAPPTVRPNSNDKGRVSGARSVKRSILGLFPSSTAVTEMNPSEPSVELEAVSKQTTPPTTTLNLCENIRHPTNPDEYTRYELILDSSIPPKNTYALYPIPPIKYREQCDRTITPLHEVLGQNHRCMVLSEQDRLNLAVLISSSLLQLHGSAWMPQVIRSRDVYLVQSADDPICDRFFVLKTLPNVDSPASEIDAQLASMRNQTLFYLGVLLIELALGAPFELLRRGQDQSSTGSQFFTDYRTAKRLVDQVNSLIGPNYGSAISRCIDGKFHGRAVGLEDEDLSHDVYAGVVALLEKDVENAMI